MKQGPGVLLTPVPSFNPCYFAMLPLGNTNTLTYDAAEARKSRWYKRNLLAAPAMPLTAAAAETQLLHEQRWPGLTVQLLAEPGPVTPILLLPPRQLRLILLLSGAMRIGLHTGGQDFTYRSAPGTVKLTTPQHEPYEMQWVPLSAEPVRSAHLYLANRLVPELRKSINFGRPAPLASAGRSISPAAVNQSIGIVSGRDASISGRQRSRTFFFRIANSGTSLTTC